MKITIREPKTQEDFFSLSNLAEQLAKFHDEKLRPDPLKLMEDREWYSSRLISVDNMDVGFVGWHKLYACQSAERGIELQNLYVNEKCRGLNLGIRLVLEVVRDAISLQCSEIKIGLRKENTKALEFYKKLGCTVIDRNDSWRCKINITQMKKIISRADQEIS